ncbi:dTDP-4-dehydrorhamnose 3,5-epimerase [Brevundimonas vesicularis]|uniref:dTDP-4-dehydrorhamnose 3,5-epimerase n=1 Tax=Brevundimonas vesicularis TaxID=41276 RepID=UPI0038D384C8
MTPIEVLVIRSRRHGDDRGWFQETWSRTRFEGLGIDCAFVQDNHSRSEAAGVVRGLHFQSPPHAQAKLVRCVRGAILDVMVDLRAGAPTYGQAYQVELSEETGDQVFVPPCFAHGFVTLRPGTEVIYKVSAPYAPDHEAGLAWDDPALGIDWPVDPATAQLSPRDRLWPRLAGLASPFSGTEPSRLRVVQA